MGTNLVIAAPRQVGFETSADAPLSPNEVRIKTLYSGISAGTEMTQYRGTSPHLHKRWDNDTRLFVPGEETSLDYPIRTFGYEEAGEVIEVGEAVTDITVGAHVFGTWGHRTHHVADVDYVRPRLMPAGAEPIMGIFSHIGAIALNGVDLLDSRLEVARQLGAHETLNAGRDKAAEAIKDLTGGRGADVCFEVSGSTVALNEAIRAAAYSARVVAMGFFQGEGKGMFLGEEFHHNRINVVCSQIGGTDPELQYRWNKLRLWQTAIRLQVDGVLNLRPLITHTAPFEHAAELFDLLDRNPDPVMQAVMEFV